MGSWLLPHQSNDLGDDSDNVFANFHFKYVLPCHSFPPPPPQPLHQTSRPFLTLECSSTQAHSAPARGWDIERFERSDSGTVLQYEGSSPIKESGPWSHLQTFALSAPGHHDQRSQDFQIEAISQWPSSVQNSEMFHHPTTQSRDQRQASMRQRRMPERPYSAEEDRAGYPRHHYPTGSARSPHLAAFGAFQHRIPRSGQQQVADSSTSSSFSQPATSGLHTDSIPAQSFDSRWAYPFQPNSNSMKPSNARPRQDLAMDYPLDWGLADGSGNSSLPDSQCFLSSEESSWQQQNSLLFGNELSASVATACGSHEFGLTVDDQARPSGFLYDPVLGEATNQIDNESGTLDHPDAIKIERPGGHYKSGLTSWFPPSEDSLPDYPPVMQEGRQYREITSSSQPTVSSFSLPNFSHRKNPTKSTFARPPRSDSLSVIQEYGHSQPGDPGPSRNSSVKGRRNGPLSTATALAAAQKRKDGNVCIRCRTMKMTVGRSGRR